MFLALYGHLVHSCGARTLSNIVGIAAVAGSPFWPGYRHLLLLCTSLTQSQIPHTHVLCVCVVFHLFDHIPWLSVLKHSGYSRTDKQFTRHHRPAMLVLLGFLNSVSKVLVYFCLHVTHQHLNFRTHLTVHHDVHSHSTTHYKKMFVRFCPEKHKARVYYACCPSGDPCVPCLYL